MPKQLDLDFETLIENCLHSVLNDSSKYKRALKKKIIESYITDEEEIKSLKKGELLFPTKKISLKWEKGYGYRGQPDEIINFDALLDVNGGHGGGDLGLISALYDMLVSNNNPETSLEASIESHLIGINAEESRLNNGKLIYLHKK